MSRPRLPLLLLLTAALTACDDGGDDDDTDAGANGTAPTISALTLDPATVPRGAATNVTASLRFVDPDGDIELGHVALMLSGQTQTLPPVTVQNVAGLTEAEVLLLLRFQPPTTDPIEVEVWLTDAAGNLSNTLTTELTVTDP